MQRAEALLHDIAIELLRVPARGDARELHVRALRLKRQVDAWTPHISEATVQTTMEQLLVLHREACDARRVDRTGPSPVQWTCSARSLPT
jgi:hypothetical protein